MQKTQEIELVNFLSKLDKKHVNELIDILTDFGKGRVALNSNVKEVLLAEKQISISPTYSKEFIELIITEFQLFSGNSLVNQVRKNLVSYEDILNDVYQCVVDTELQGNIKSFRDKEEAILYKLLGSEWQKSNFSQRFKKSKEFSLLAKTSLQANKTGFLAIGFISKLNLPSLAFSSVLSFSTEAYRIMIPFIVQIGWLKIVYGFYSNNLAVKKESYVETKKEFTKIEEDNVSRLNQLIAHVPDLMIKNEMSKNNLAILNVPLEELKSAKDGNGLRAIIMGKEGIKENARIFTPEKLQNLVNTGVLMNLASTLVAQKHLADINQKLNKINEGIENINDFLSSERKSKITAAYKEANRTYNSLSKGNVILYVKNNVLTNHLSSLQQVYEHIQKDINKVIKDIEVTSKVKIEKLSELIKRLNDYCYEFRFCCNTIMAIYAVFFIQNKQQYDFIENMIELYEETQIYMDEISDRLNRKLEELFEQSKSIFNFSSTDLSNFAFMKNRKFDFNNVLCSFGELKSFSNLFLENKSLEIQVELENGKIKNAYL